eukprot:TRINITY_DN7114_c0_g1_i8.p1 TRINITY_DN7114_c0_g1~~TRINITY_DN7114_c0_g1_i8.p1  ORF type:complete len:297 (+),score=92.08 TRINITY_DN7114_c0_g1_i8:76-966(+)
MCIYSHLYFFFFFFFFFQAEDGIRDAQESRGLGDVYKRQYQRRVRGTFPFRAMGNSGSNTSEPFNELPDSPTVRLNRDVDFPLVVNLDPNKGKNRLPKRLIFRLTPSHCEFWRAHDGEAAGVRPVKAISYFNVLGWGHSNVVLRLIESCEVVVQGGKMVKKRNVYEFHTREGEKITKLLSISCHAIVSDINTKRNEERLVEKEREWNEYWVEKERQEAKSISPIPISPVIECMSPLAGTDVNPKYAMSAMSLTTEDLLSGSLRADTILDADIERIRSESPVPSPLIIPAASRSPVA